MTSPSTQGSSAEVVVPARDGYQLSGTVFLPERHDPARVALVGSAMAVRQRFYAPFARFLARQGFTVLTFDYRGSEGGGREKSSGAELHDWGELDLSGAIDWLEKTYNATGVRVVAHSVSAQLLGLAANNDRLGPVVLVAPQSGYWRLFGWPFKIVVAAAWYAAFPVLAAAFGRLPAFVLGGIELPAGVAKEWARWGRHPDYILSHSPDTRAGFGRIVSPLLVFSMADDRFAPPAAVAEIVSWYGSRQVERRVLTPPPRGFIGHFGFFREGAARDAWEQTASFLAQPLRR
jgi:predicted alpha/beta hydrolase